MITAQNDLIVSNHLYLDLSVDNSDLMTLDDFTDRRNPMILTDLLIVGSSYRMSALSMVKSFY